MFGCFIGVNLLSAINGEAVSKGLEGVILLSSRDGVDGVTG